MLLSVLASVAQTEADNLSEHIALGYEMSRRLGKPTKTLRPYGYNFNKENKLMINKKEAKVVKLMFEMALSGESSNGIATYFNIDLEGLLNSSNAYNKINYTASFDLTTIPKFENEPYVVLNDNKPDFNEKDLDDAIEVYRSRNRKFGAK